MKVIICGAGQVGWQIARHLSGERNDVTVVDNNPELVRRVTDTLDVQVGISNCYFETPVYAFWRYRTVGWTTASPANLGYIDSNNNNTYTYPAGDTHNVRTRFWTPGDVRKRTAPG